MPKKRQYTWDILLGSGDSAYSMPGCEIDIHPGAQRRKAIIEGCRGRNLRCYRELTASFIILILLQDQMIAVRVRVKIVLFKVRCRIDVG